MYNRVYRRTIRIWRPICKVDLQAGDAIMRLYIKKFKKIVGEGLCAILSNDSQIYVSSSSHQCIEES